MIGPSITIRGTVSGDEDLVVEGRIEGAVRLTKSLTVAEGAHLTATVEATSVSIDGTVHGDIQASEGVDVASGAEVVGDVACERFSLADGARFKGRISMDFEVPGGAPPARRR